MKNKLPIIIIAIVLLAYCGSDNESVEVSNNNTNQVSELSKPIETENFTSVETESTRTVEVENINSTEEVVHEGPNFVDESDYRFNDQLSNSSSTSSHGQVIYHSDSSSSTSTNSSQSSTSDETRSSNYNLYDNPENQRTTETYVLNTNTGKIHHSWCSSVSRISPKNYATTSKSLDELYRLGYEPCKKCF